MAPRLEARPAPEVPFLEASSGGPQSAITPPLDPFWPECNGRYSDAHILTYTHTNIYNLNENELFEVF